MPNTDHSLLGAEFDRPGHPGRRTGERLPNKGRKFPAKPLTPAKVTAITGQCSRRTPTGIRNRALLTLLHRFGLRNTR